MIDINIDTILISVVGSVISMLIAMVAFFLKKQIKALEDGIKLLNLDIVSFREASFKECASHRQIMYSDFYKRDLLDERKETLEQRVKRIEEKMNGMLK